MRAEVEAAYEEGKRLEKAFSFTERREVTKQIQREKAVITDLLGASKENYLCFLSSLSEGLLKTVYEILLPRAQRNGRTEILVPRGERKEIVDLLKRAGRLGITVKEVETDEFGRVSKESLEKALTKRTLAFFLSWTEMFTGAIHPIYELGELCKQEEVFFFVEGSESIGKVFFRFETSGIDAFTFSYDTMAALCLKNQTMLRGESFGEDFSLPEFFSLAAFARESLDGMDVNSMRLSSIKNQIVEFVMTKDSTVTFYNDGGDFLYDRWCFSFDGVVCENLAYLLREKGIDVLYGKYLSLTFSSEDSKEALMEKWSTILEAARALKEYTYV